MKRLFTIALFFWACTFTQQAQMVNTDQHTDTAAFGKGIQFKSKNLTDFSIDPESIAGKTHHS